MRRTRIQQTARHLLRSMASDDLQEVSADLDEQLWRAFDRLRGGCVPTSDESFLFNRDRSILSLPPSLGGLGLLSHVESRPHAYAASEQSANVLLQVLLPDLMVSAFGSALNPPSLVLGAGSSTASSTQSITVARSSLALGADSSTPLPSQSVAVIRSQRDRCQEALVTRYNILFASLQPHEQVTMIESAAKLGRRWLSVFPSLRFQLSSKEIQAALHYRTLLPSGGAGLCIKCAGPSPVGHDENCPGVPAYTIARHDRVKFQLAAGLRSSPILSITIEPRIGNMTGPSTGRRNDLRVVDTSPLATYPIIDYDVKEVMSLFAATNLVTHNRALPPAPPLQPLTSLSTTVRRRIQRTLAQAAKAKRSALPPGEHTHNRFLPLIFTTGGIMEEATMGEIQGWNRHRQTDSTAISYMMAGLSIALVRARGMTFQGPRDGCQAVPDRLT